VINGATAVTASATLAYSGCSVLKPAGKGCVVKAGTITTKALEGTTEGQPENKLKIAPSSGTEIASVTIEKCSVGSLNNTFPVTGSLVATTSGATLFSLHPDTTTQNTLKFGGVKAGLDGPLTIVMFGGGNPINITP
jgi:hypothetical protein